MKFVSLLALAVLLTTGAQAKKKPNILFLMSDSMDGRVVDTKAPQSAAIELPFLRDFFEKEGTSFVRTYANSPQCVPSRASMCTGRRTDQIEAWSNEKGVAASPDGMLDDQCVHLFGADTCKQWAKTQRYNETIFTAMNKLGYGVNLYGKIDIGAGVQNNQTLAGVTSADGWHGGATITIATRTADIRRPTKPEPDSMTDDVANKVHQEDWVTVQRCQDWIGTLPEESDSTKPFFLYCSVNIPHPAFKTNATWLEKVDVDKIPKPPWRKDFPSAWHPYDSYMTYSKNVAGDYTDEDILKVRKTYYAMCAETDFLLNRVWESLKEKGYNLDNTYVVYVSDHGEMNMEHRQVWKNSMYEASTRVPFQIAGPGVAKGKRVEQLTSLLDVFPTLVDMARETDWGKHSELSGKSVLPLAQPDHHESRFSMAPQHLSSTFDEERAMISQYHSNMGNTGAFMVRKAQWKYITFGHTLSAFDEQAYHVQLFNVDEDPDEMTDVAAQNPDVVKELDAELRSKFDPQAADRKAITEDKAMFDRFFGSLSKFELEKKLRNSYSGFDHSDWQKLQNWMKETASLTDPSENTIVI